MRKLSLSIVLAAVALAGCGPRLATERTAGRIEIVALLHGPMPTGVAVSRKGRIFVNFPRWGDNVDFTVAELRGGRAVPYPSAAINLTAPSRQAETLVSVQSVVVDPKDRLWILDTGSPLFQPTTFGGPKLVGVDLKTDQVFKTILFPADVALPTTYLNDVRFDLARGAEGMAFITDSSSSGPNAIIVVDLATGKSWRRLGDHPSVKAAPAFLPIVEGRPLLRRPPRGEASPLAVGADGIAISPDGQRLYYCPLSSRRLYSVSVDALANPGVSDADVAKTVVDHGEKGASDGLESDAQGRIYCTDYENNAIHRLLPDGYMETLVADPRVLWPDTLCVAPGYLYFTANQLHRQAGFHYGKDLRKKPYVLFRARIAATPIAMR